MRSIKHFSLLCIFIFIGLTAGCNALYENKQDLPAKELKSKISDVISRIDEEELLKTVKELQGFRTRVFRTEGNVKAGEYLFKRLESLKGVNVSYQNEKLRNIIATYPGFESDSKKIYMIGGHYDSTSKGAYAPGATDNGIGVAIVLEFARLLSQYKFKHTIVFALWNAEEKGLQGSRAYVKQIKKDGVEIGLYINYDSAGYDPKNRLIIDLIYNEDSKWAAEKQKLNNDIYNIGFKKINMVTKACRSDYTPFWLHRYPAISSHTESHGPAHTPKDTVDKVSITYAKKNTKLGMSLLLELAKME